MKTRKQIIAEILEKNLKLSVIQKQAVLRESLLAMQDALLFSLAQDLEINLNDTESESMFQILKSHVENHNLRVL